MLMHQHQHHSMSLNVTLLQALVRLNFGEHQPEWDWDGE